MRTTLVDKQAGHPKGLNDRLMTRTLLLSHGKRLATLVSAFAPTSATPDEIKHKFYEDLNTVIFTAIITTNADKLIIPGDFKARVGRDSAT